MSFSLLVSAGQYSSLREHLGSGDVEQVCFLVAVPCDSSGLKVTDFYPVPPEEFDFQSDFHVSLRDEVRASVIKRAWDAGGCLVEAHSHENGDPVRFSASDLSGFDEWVPHVRWRLRQRPYVALVFGDDTFDALVWGDGDTPEPISEIRIDGTAVITPTNISYHRLLEGSQ
jgi:hypothetical protein